METANQLADQTNIPTAFVWSDAGIKTKLMC